MRQYKLWKIIIIIWVLFCIFGAYKSFTQTYKQQSNQAAKSDVTYVIHRDYWDRIYEWDCLNCDQWGSFYWKITRTRQRWSDGYYYYFIYFYSNSLFDEKDRYGKYEMAISYIKDIKITMTDKYKGSYAHEIEYELIDWEVTHVARFYSLYHNNIFKLQFGSVDPYD